MKLEIKNLTKKFKEIKVLVLLVVMGVGKVFY